MRRFFTCQDGKQRTNIKITIRLTQEELDKAQKIAKKLDGDLYSWLSGVAGLAVEGEIDESDEW